MSINTKKLDRLRIISQEENFGHDCYMAASHFDLNDPKSFPHRVMSAIQGDSHWDSEIKKVALYLVACDAIVEYPDCPWMSPSEMAAMGKRYGSCSE